jgi:polyisoprenyl-teichoic acid--peptidoglycan teichoic acid transferase
LSLVPRSRAGALSRFALGAAIVIVFTAATTAVAGLLQFRQFAKDLSGTPSINRALVSIPNPGNAQTILVIGSDHRAKDPQNEAHTDTMMLVRMDPDSSTVNVISIPRDLKVDIPEHGSTVTDKLNAAYSVGGANLLIRILREQVFPDLHVNHIVDVNFGGFAALVDAIGCVYTDVDHRYFNDTAVTNYSSINLQAGYQKLCGSDALAFVRFRHTDNDIVRNARQQDFVRWAKDQYGPASLVANRDKLLRIFGQHTQTDPDLHSVDGLINLFNLVAFSAGHTIKQVPFPAILLPCTAAPQGARGAAQTPCYVGAESGAERRAFDAFMTPTQPVAGNNAPRRGAERGGGGGVNAPDTTADVADGKAQAAALRGAGLPVYFPRLLAVGSQYQGPTPPEYPRTYEIHDQSGRGYPSYRMVVTLNPNLGQYYGVQGTTWQNAPILDNPNETRTVGGKRVVLYYTGHKLATVAWRTSQGVYWISNTLTADLSNAQMLAIASSLTQG